MKQMKCGRRPEGRGVGIRSFHFRAGLVCAAAFLINLCFPGMRVASFAAVVAPGHTSSSAADVSGAKQVGLIKTTTTLSASPSSVTLGQSVTLTAQVTGKRGATPTGTVIFSSYGLLLGTATLANGRASVSAAATHIVAGVYPVIAAYSGSLKDAASVSAALNVGVDRVNTTTALTAGPNPGTIGQTVTLKATVSPASGSVKPAGTVEFLVGGAQLGLATLSNGVAQYAASSTTVPAGAYVVTARYRGSATYNSSSSSAVTVTLSVPPPSGTPLSACADLTVSGSYYLAQSVSSSGTCFFIDADNITLNLNGNTITYGTGGGTASTPAILLADTWYTAPGYSLAKTGSTNKHGGFVVYGGNITAASNAAPRSTALWVGQSDDITPAPVVHNLTLTTYSTDASPIFGTVSASGWQIYDNTVNYASVTTTSRYNLWGYAIWIADNPNAAGSPPDQIYGNKIIGAPQGGIFDDHQNALIHNNDITFKSFYANDYCVATLSGDGQTVSYNNCHPASGRGIDVEAANEIVAHNTITVTELPQDAEYGGCEEAGADGIRVRDNVYQGNPSAPSNITVNNNIITAIAVACQANGLRLTNLQAGDSVTYSDNTVTTTGPGNSTAPDYAISFDGDNQPTLTFTSNSLSSVYAFVQVDWDGANLVMGGSQNLMNVPLIFLDDENGYNDPSEDGPTFSQSITVDSSKPGTIKCGSYAAGPASFGSTSQTCN